MLLVVVPVSEVWYTGVSVHRALNVLKIEHKVFDYRRILQQLGGDYARLQEVFKDAVNEINPDLILFCKAEAIFPTTMKRLKCKTALWNWDFNPHLWREARARAMNVDYFFSIVIDHRREIKFLSSKTTKSFWLPQAADTEFYHPWTEPVEERFKSDIAFIGSPWNTRIERINRTAIAFKKYPATLKIWGDGWGAVKKEDVSAMIMGEGAHGEDFMKVCKGASVILNLTKYPWRKIQYAAVSQRLFMLAACKACFLTERGSRGMNLFYPQKLLWFLKPNTLKHLIKNPEKRYEVAEELYQHTIKNHTYVHRLKELLTICEYSQFAQNSSWASEAYSGAARKPASGNINPSRRLQKADLTHPLPIF